MHYAANVQYTNKRRTLPLVYNSNSTSETCHTIHTGCNTQSKMPYKNTIRHLNTHRSASASEVAPAAVSLVEVKSSACKVRMTLDDNNP